MTWEPGCREVPATDPPDYDLPDDPEPWWDAARELTDAEQDAAERAHETYYQPTEGDRGGGGEAAGMPAAPEPRTCKKESEIMRNVDWLARFPHRCYFYPGRDCPGWEADGTCGRIGQHIPANAGAADAAES